MQARSDANAFARIERSVCEFIFLTFFMFSGADDADLGVGSHNVPQIDDAPPSAMQKKSKSQRNSCVSFATGALLPPPKFFSLHLTFTSPGLIPCSSSFQKSSLTLQSWIRWACRSPNSIP